ncbi:MAG: Lrp/AsnC family transcriptional regulator [Acidimicrobiales bacterium]|uniref:HTH asnC-type domain-containing protein n=1 Tax=marine metagenome TaxID=408172 RepID=A0A381ZSN5_9ZZZZ|nr:AsnC family transcriptional regulator [Acidimicrobiaceae bacterium]MCS5679275.1 Lrp/AsnC family transcriptional regulator [Acidimicrobiales bacterium]MEC9202412.1 Lrp/AsnC family transcriptional regulator [Actinomycetota bacterium]MEE3114789.1 Lrp/AsnC family transcriptional regulator [Actinomycetota bacterium]MEE3212215.1 Lrp/AsnC family transcriptional regulator [Actinomycetota bacterium]|tara:strand:- start:41 stop:511 length:471 start_codon:yes stop_codon:yes gene_type:complete
MSEPRSEIFALDDVDKAIIRELQVDGRMAYAQLSPKVGLSQAAVRQRVNRLLERGVFQIVAVSDPLSLGLTTQAMVGITVTGDVRGVAATVAAMGESEYVLITTGRYDVLAELLCTDNDALLELVNDRIRVIDGVAATEVFSILKMEKLTFSWGTG